MENDTTNGLIRSVDFRDKRYRLETGSGGNEIFYFQWPTMFRSSPVPLRVTCLGDSCSMLVKWKSPRGPLSSTTRSRAYH